MKLKSLIFTTLFLCIGLFSKAQTKGDAILGEWLSQEKDGKILVYKQGEKFFGKISWGKSTGRKDDKNPDPSLKTRDLIGSVILKDFVFDGENSWKEGTIYDPNSGKTYSCKMKLDSPTALNIRGYIGFSLFGRTSIWTKVK